LWAQKGYGPIILIKHFRERFEKGSKLKQKSLKEAVAQKRNRITAQNKMQCNRPSPREKARAIGLGPNKPTKMDRAEFAFRRDT
jgi:hypothetical protein